MKSLARSLVAAVGTALGAASHAAPALTPANYVDVGDTIVEMLDTSALASSTMLLGQDAMPRALLASLTTPPAQTQTFNTPCPGGGSVSGSILDRDASGDMSVNDRFVTVFKACRVGNETVSGSSEFVITASRTLNGVETTELAFRFHHLGSEAMRWDGPARASLRSDRKTGAEQFNVTYQDMAVTRGAQSTRWNFTLEVRRPPLGDHTAQIGGAMTLGHDVLRLVQDEPFVIAPGGQPRAGQLSATDADGDRLEVVAGRRRYQYRFFAHGNRGVVPDSSSQSKLHGGS